MTDIMKKIIGKDKVKDLLSQLSDYEIFAPVEQAGVIAYKPLDMDFLLEFPNSKKPPKEMFFPQTEKMFDFEVEGTKITGARDAELPDNQVLLFGIRPCDARAAAILDTVFSWDYVDPYYVNRRKNATTISFSCNEARDSCFCTSVGGSPSSTEGSDMLWTDIGDSYFVESLTDKGHAILEQGGSLFTEADEAEKAAATDTKLNAEETFTRHFELEGVAEGLENAFTSDYWEEFAKRCIGCGICTLLCPTCHCFDINDVITKGKAWRERTWDSCQFPYYTIHASGHNPRPAKNFRQRNRIYHKFLYMGKNLDVIGCVGCGRCITGCPVNIDIIEVVEGVKALKRPECGEAPECADEGEETKGVKA